MSFGMPLMPLGLPLMPFAQALDTFGCNQTRTSGGRTRARPEMQRATAGHTGMRQRRRIGIQRVWAGWKREVCFHPVQTHRMLAILAPLRPGNVPRSQRTKNCQHRTLLDRVGTEFVFPRARCGVICSPRAAVSLRSETGAAPVCHRTKCSEVEHFRAAGVESTDRRSNGTAKFSKVRKRGQKRQAEITLENVSHTPHKLEVHGAYCFTLMPGCF